MKKKLLIVLVMICCIGMLGACSKKSSSKSSTLGWAELKKKGTVVVGVDDSFVPMGFRDDKNHLVGFDIDLAKAVFKELGVKVKFQAIEWSMKETELKNGSIDVIWNGYTMTNDRKEKVSFTNPYLKNDQIVVSLKKNNITTIEQLKNKVLGVQQGSSGADALNDSPAQLLNKIKDQTPVLYDTYAEAFLDLKSGRIDGLLIDRVFAEYYISHEKSEKEYATMKTSFATENYAIGVRKGDSAFVKALNQALKTNYENGKAKEISEKWFGEDKIVPQK
ncbi:amino acid ABC transporter substrate-binding protein [Vagococcus entomophilus]|uniref:Amino acid ABC transporter substrate-binding protein n=1 Tax=Vagococcus entomophilus TaxID=1160095 RepID=A0A430AEM4_9ENTE|nr:amino acid ABC transporter substrate-binding protein [Vagococcus entomophilus]RSU05892.1 amino acid ABC transporter substrate-binding protein [Vagococcus entomophilus]